MNSKYLMAGIVVAVLAVAGIGAAFAYNASTTNVGNDLDTNYLTITQAGNYYSELQDGMLVYDTVDGYFLKTDIANKNANADPVTTKADITDTTKTEKIKKYSVFSQDSTDREARETNDSEYRHSTAISIDKSVFKTGAQPDNNIAAYVAGWEKLTVTNSVAGLMPNYTLRTTATNLNQYVASTNEGGYEYYVVLAGDFTANGATTTLDADKGGYTYLVDEKTISGTTEGTKQLHAVKLVQDSTDSTKWIGDIDIAGVLTTTDGAESQDLFVYICIVPPSNPFQKPDTAILGAGNEASSSFEFKAIVKDPQTTNEP